MTVGVGVAEVLDFDEVEEVDEVAEVVESLLEVEEEVDVGLTMAEDVETTTVVDVDVLHVGRMFFEVHDAELVRVEVDVLPADVVFEVHEQDVINEVLVEVITAAG